ncbi:hypothetical protein Patl1_08977 [Pistacia atlantica]|uniref:Uncharacterized protein n=1 Tax=Pistacia atlantica TaxID=434234 RepID=A0ACC1AEM9_9ROSI|nr:hypothetical protein Patl1_08977 [Pistacia atlantica]
MAALSVSRLELPSINKLAMFWRFDADGDRRLSKQELNNAFSSLGSSFPAWRTWRALCHADENGYGYINEKEFDELVKYAVKCGYVIS